jgi:hypothetical protein
MRVELNGLITRIIKDILFFIYIVCIYRIQDVTVWHVTVWNVHIPHLFMNKMDTLL